MKVFLYARSPEQLRELREYADSRRNFEIKGVFGDLDHDEENVVGLPGPGLCEMFYYVDRGDSVYLYSKEGWQIADLVHTEDAIRQRGAIAKWFKEHELTPQEKTLEKVLRAHLKYQVRWKGVRARAGWRMRQKTGRSTCAVPPYGWRKRHKGNQWVVEPNDKELEILELMISKRKEGLTYEKIAQALNGMGHRRRDRKEFTKVNVHRYIKAYEKRQRAPEKGPNMDWIKVSRY